MTEYDFREKTINDLYNEKIKEINRRCNKEEISNYRRIDKIKRDKNTRKPRKWRNYRNFKERKEI